MLTLILECVEYDFAKIKNFIGFIYPVEYTTNRPTLSLQDVGIKKVVLDSTENIEYEDPNTAAFLSYLLVKNTCWNYEKEWRIINTGEPNNPLFLDLPFIKSITAGINMDPICKHLLWDVCTEKEIEYYEISLNTENFVLSRNLLTENDFVYDMDTENDYVNILVQQIINASTQIGKATKSFDDSSENGVTDFANMKPMLADIINMISNAYYLKISSNRVTDNIDKNLLSPEMVGLFLDGVSHVNTIVSEAKQFINSLEISLPN